MLLRNSGKIINALIQIPSPAVRVYPNPGNHHLNISLPPDFIEGRVELFDNAGSLMLGKTIAGSRASLYTGSLPSGIYLYRIFSNETIIGSGKWVKEK